MTTTKRKQPTESELRDLDLCSQSEIDLLRWRAGVHRGAVLWCGMVHLLGQKLVELVAEQLVAVEPEQPELAAMTSQIPTTQEIPPSRHRLAADVDPDFFKNTGPAAVEEWPFGRSPRAG